MNLQLRDGSLENSLMPVNIVHLRDKKTLLEESVDNWLNCKHNVFFIPCYADAKQSAL